MARVCRAGGTVVVEDIYASEHPGARGVSRPLGNSARSFARPHASAQRTASTLSRRWAGDGFSHHGRRSDSGSRALAGDHKDAARARNRNTPAPRGGPPARPKRHTSVSRCDRATFLPCPHGDPCRTQGQLNSVSCPEGQSLITKHIRTYWCASSYCVLSLHAPKLCLNVRDAVSLRNKMGTTLAVLSGIK